LISKTHIQKTVTQLAKLHQENIGDRKGLYFAKLAILEVCGWIEESMDNIVLLYANRHLSDVQNTNYTRTEIIKRTTSFEYDRHFRLMLMRILGIIGLEKLEMRFDTTKFTNMRSSLSLLKQSRDQQAHTHIKGTTMVIDAPSVTERHFQNVYIGLKHIESLIRKVKI
jgi:hypothetical protein